MIFSLVVIFVNVEYFLEFQYAFTIDEENRLEHIFGHLLIVLIGIKNMEM